ncbi:hypothetical protein ACL9RL_17540 [Plantibacter sp. Mn2098]|uniref:hypothetical protein n=1 Tax=Plantibacter sp. Mn2098 TaxID=3395266 RepID=UPI003BEB3573
MSARMRRWTGWVLVAAGLALDLGGIVLLPQIINPTAAHYLAIVGGLLVMQSGLLILLDRPALGRQSRFRFVTLLVVGLLLLAGGIVLGFTSRSLLGELTSVSLVALSLALLVSILVRRARDARRAAAADTPPARDAPASADAAEAAADTTADRPASASAPAQTAPTAPTTVDTATTDLQPAEIRD